MSSASISNLLLYIGAQSVEDGIRMKRVYSDRWHDDDLGGSDTIDVADALALQMNEECATVVAVPMAAALLALVCLSHIALIIAGVIVLILVALPLGDSL